MIEGYIIEGKRFLREDPEPDFFTGDTVFTNLADAIEGGSTVHCRADLHGLKKGDVTVGNL